MPPVSILGTHVIEFQGDGTHLKRTLASAEQAAGAAAKKIDSAIGVGVSDSLSKAARAGAAAAPKLLAPYRDLVPILRNANRLASEFEQKRREGAVITARDVQKLTIAEKALQAQVKATFQTVEQATAGAAAGYNRVRVAQERAVALSRQQRIVAREAVNATTEAGFRATSLSDVVQDAARNYGAVGAIAGGLAQNLFIALLAQKQLSLAARVYAADLGASGILEYWKKVGSEILKAKQERETQNRERLSDTIVAAGRAAFGDGSMADVTSTMKGGGKNWFERHANRGIDASGVASQAKRLAAYRQYLGDEPMARAVEDYYRRARSESEALTDRLKREAEATARLANQRRLLGEWDTQDMHKALSPGGWAWEEVERKRQEQEYRDEQARAAAEFSRRASEYAAKNAPAEGWSERVHTAMIQRVVAAYESGATSIENVMGAAFGHVEGFAETLFSGTIRSFDDLGDAGRNMLRNLQMEIARFMAQKAVMWLLNLYATRGWSSQAALGAMMQASPGVTVGANGGVAPGGFRAFASGGIVTRPTLGLIGEGRNNEAVVPLPDGRSIPVEMQGRGRQPLNIEVSWSPEFIRGIVSGAAAQGADQASRMVIPIVASDIQRNGVLRKLIQTSA